MDKEVKGSFFAEYVKMMRSRKQVDWSRFLKPSDMRFLHQEIIDTQWYPFDTFERMGIGILHEIANSDREIVRLWGRLSLEDKAKRNRDLVCAEDPAESLIRFQVMRQNFFNFDPIKIILLFKNYARVEIKYGMSKIAEEAATWQAIGYIERLLELCGANNVRHRFLRKMWNDKESSIIEFDWSNVRPDMKVQGVLFLDYVKMVKSKKDADWSLYLLPKDFSYLKMRIQPGEWYPFDTFERMGLGIIKEIASGDIDMARVFGIAETESLVALYPEMVCKGDPRESIMRAQVLRKSFFNFDAMNLEVIYGDYARVRIDYRMCRAAEQAACMQAAGFLIRLLELAGASRPQYSFSGKGWDGYPLTILELKWK